MEQNFDICVIGGGIQGAGIAQAAALSGLSVALVEKSDWGAGTSSKSSKLIHGGLRYLESFEFGLVRESLKERRTLLNIAGDIVKPNWFY
ncbi:MAG: FAD-dependent oxidoreductase, partial [Porticoccaceae bacterium]